MANDINVKIKNWYKKKYPKDELGEGLNNTNTFKDLENALNKGGDVYKVMGEDDSVIRERLFQQLAKVKGVEYEDIYQKWLWADTIEIFPLDKNGDNIKIF